MYRVVSVALYLKRMEGFVDYEGEFWLEWMAMKEIKQVFSKVESPSKTSIDGFDTLKRLISKLLNLKIENFAFCRKCW
jgi:hypothetical protein